MALPLREMSRAHMYPGGEGARGGATAPGGIARRCMMWAEALSGGARKEGRGAPRPRTPGPGSASWFKLAWAAPRSRLLPSQHERGEEGDLPT
eukprot:scaffold536_cov409-Prasinococcus_capsulatus_cf.AAC.1